ncbi:hypothetical protein Pcinc_035668 [Petrolisthes cinctipes]|uniref:Protein Wnt n=1 Tax=Petrolisthes cinctipes TaxID=88211 RepID=A0AAE1BWA2_PETCI|nr:hypothetical protein Pcinc_035668 [Petrolisthes cinctipes]
MPTGPYSGLGVTGTQMEARGEACEGGVNGGATWTHLAPVIITLLINQSEFHNGFRHGGWLHVRDNMRKECKCHGMSGSCTVKTCWWRLPYFRQVGDVLKDRFDGASRVVVRSVGANARNPNDRRPNRRRKTKRQKRKSLRLFRPFNPNLKPPSKKDLVYLEDSPDFCVRNKKLGILGTRGRECNRTSIGLDGCDLMCCGREYHTRVVEEEKRCSCTFQWCCEVKLYNNNETSVQQQRDQCTTINKTSVQRDQCKTRPVYNELCVQRDQRTTRPVYNNETSVQRDQRTTTRPVYNTVYTVDCQ